MEPIAVVTHLNTKRLTHVLDWLFGERLGVDYVLQSPGYDTVDGKGCVIAYGAIIDGALSIPAAGLLSATGVQAQEGLDEAQQWQGLPVMFPVTSPGYTLPFDLFSAIFYHISRYEEYLPHTPDKHGRYPYTESWLHRKGCLQRPIVDEWMHQLAQLLKNDYGVVLRRPGFSFTPTYDIDIAYSHAYKGFGRLAGAYVRALLKGDLEQIAERTQVLKKKQRDPYD
ncbi:MAG: hypothetical protein EBZ77_15865, partial [Chitinophagia bacterium]|nr:hypothetical protein [Chitinophagia bacterium]